mgnify:CR=1 FL=1
MDKEYWSTETVLESEGVSLFLPQRPISCIKSRILLGIPILQTRWTCSQSKPAPMHPGVPIRNLGLNEWSCRFMSSIVCSLVKAVAYSSFSSVSWFPTIKSVSPLSLFLMLSHLSTSFCALVAVREVFDMMIAL